MASLVAPEFYAYANTTVALGGYTAASGVLNVASTGSPFSTTQQFRVLIADQVTGAVKAILKITAQNSGTQWACSSDGLDASAVAGDLVQLCLTSGAMDQIRADMNQVVSGSLPTVAKTGDTIYTDDGVVMRFNGSVFVPVDVYNPGMVNPRLTSFSWRNQQSSVVTQGLASELITHAVGLSGQTVCREVSLTAPYTITAAFQPMKAESGGGLANGLYLTDGTKLVRFQFSQGNAGGVYKFNTVSSFSAGYVNINMPSPWGHPIVFRIQNDGTNLIFSFLPDGVTPMLVYTSTKGDWLASQALGGFFMDNSNSSELWACKLISWKVT